ncbi:MAG: undecaprenyl-diphosphate phosphatase, partial [Succinivibrio sp.]
PIAKIGFCVIIGTIPVCIAGAFFEGYVSTVIRDSIHVIAWATIGFRLLLGFASYVNRKVLWKHLDTVEGARADSLRHLSYSQALLIGLAQMLAIIPGTSRSGVTLTAGLFLGMKPEAAARFSFLLSIPVIMASALFEIIKIYKDQTLELQWVNMILGGVLSFVVALIVIHLFLKFIAKSGMAIFVIYRVLLGALLLWLF